LLAKSAGGDLAVLQRMRECGKLPLLLSQASKQKRPGDCALRRGRFAISDFHA